MYKVFFKDRIVFFRNNISQTIQSHSALLYKYGSRNDLKAIIDAYYELSDVKELYLVHENQELLWDEFRSCFRHIEAAGGLVRNTDNQILFILRNGVWDLPKGKADKNESMEKTALREVKEECGIYPLKIGEKIIETYHAYRIGKDNILKKTHWFEMKYEGSSVPTPQLEENITEIRWVDPDRLDFLSQNTFPSILEVLWAKEIH